VVVGLVAGGTTGVRWEHFLYPALCLGAGPLLAVLWRRGWAGRTVAVGILLLIVAYGIVRWIVQIRDYLH
ncbi:MAG: hypothetical protein HC914_21990, partial [Chloroflexaceae bacterium]|nr:hypothetical protein [Chloroflexaceae bacterium]